MSDIVKQKGNLICSKCKGVVWESWESDSIRKIAHLLAYIEYKKRVKYCWRKHETMMRIFYDEFRGRPQWYKEWAIPLVEKEFKKALPISEQELYERVALEILTNGLELP